MGSYVIVETLIIISFYLSSFNDEKVADPFAA